MIDFCETQILKRLVSKRSHEAFVCLVQIDRTGTDRVEKSTELSRGHAAIYRATLTLP